MIRPRLRVVLDINVLASCLVKRNTPPDRALTSWRSAGYDLVISEEMMLKFESVLLRDYFTRRVPRDIAIDVAQELRDRAVQIRSDSTISGIAPDSEDDLVLGTAVAGEADFLVSGDKRFLELGTFRGVRLISPAVFVAWLEHHYPWSTIDTGQ